MTYGTSDVTVRFGDVTALDGVTVTAAPGTITAVVGGDGAGKSTLLRTVVGRVAPDHGRVRAPGPEQIGFQPSTGGSWPDLTVAQNMEFVGGTYGLAGRRLADRTDALLTRAGLAAARHRLSRDLSGGMRTKLGYCLAIVHEPPLLVLDEPSTGVDPVSRVELWRLLSEAAAAGTAVLLSTSYLDEAERASSVLVLDEGRPLLSGPPAAVIASSSGVVVRTPRAVRPEYAWRHADGFRERWPLAAPDGRRPVDVDLEDVAIVAALRRAAGKGTR
jgi:ABC-2 type transport system ATP-binding protein